MRGISTSVLGTVSLLTALSRDSADGANPALPGDVDADLVRAFASIVQSDPAGSDGDNWGGGPSCPPDIELDGIGWDIGTVHLWLRAKEPTGYDLYLCLDVHGYPGDSDRDGGFVSKGFPCGGFPFGCGGPEDPGVIGSSEQFLIYFDPNPDGCFVHTLGLQLTNDRLHVQFNRMGSGPAASATLGNLGEVWQAAPLYEFPPLGSAGCEDPSTRQGTILVGIPDFHTYFEGGQGWTPHAFQWQIAAGNTQDQLTEEFVEGRFADASAPSVAESLGGTLSVYPNPAPTVVRYTTSCPGPVTLSLIDVQGRPLATLVDREHREAAVYESALPTDLPRGVLFVKLETHAGATTRKFVSVR